ncbi:MAG TPA: pyridoxamine 5'-phosphate oxidase family protein [Acetobacteraceae bacterium]
MIGETPFHSGELEAQQRAGVRSEGAGIRNWMPDQHRDFFALLPFLPIATLDEEGWPVATVLSGAPGFISSPDPNTLRVNATPNPVDPAARYLQRGSPAAVLGIALETRRRNRANGVITAADNDGLTLHVTQSFGNCPKYIQTREWAPARHETAATCESLTSLDAEAGALVDAADTFFVATSSGPGAGPAGGVDISHRGGRPGFIRRDGTLLTIPDFRGNRYFNTLGNLLLNPRAALLFIDWSSGSLLQLRGVVEIQWDGEESGEFTGAERLWRLRITDGWRIRNALPLRWTFHDFAPTTERTGTWPLRVPAVA